jgi:hypothetical protein
MVSAGTGVVPAAVKVGKAWSCRGVKAATSRVLPEQDHRVDGNGDESTAKSQKAPEAHQGRL